MSGDLYLPLGDMRNRVTISQPGSTRGNLGHATAPVEFAKRWAAIDQISGSQRYAGGQMVAEANVTITMHYTPGVQPKMTVQCGDRSFEIIYPHDVQSRHVKHVLYCKEIFA